ncbi:MAG: fatty acid kinase [Clostridia bacterium]|nr:fatty acid kinase [Clostridia bacterium]
MHPDNEDKNLLNGQKLKAMFIAAHKYFEKHVGEINSLNVYPVPDGDTGTNMGLTLKAALEGIIDNKNNNIGQIADLAADSALMGARGNSGVIFSQLLRGCARGLRGKKEATALDVAKAFQYGVVYAYRAVSKPVEGTILTVAREMAKGAKKASRENAGLQKMFEEAVKSGFKAVERTRNQLPALKEAGVVDAGGQGLLVIIKGFLAGLDGNLDISTFANAKQQYLKTDQEKVSFLTFPFCTELIIKGTNIRCNSLRRDLEPLGDSLIVAGGENLAKVHIHTNHPGEVIELCLKRGTIHNIKIDNMLDQHRKTLFDHEKEQEKEPKGAETSGVNVIAVCNGTGIEELFKNLGVSKIISGGPTMNPQVKDFVQVIRDLEGDCIILPNDKNIRLAAEQAAQLVNKNVFVVPVENIPQGLAAAMAFNEEADIEKNVKNMQDSMSDIKSGEVTFAVRQGTYHNLNFNANDILGIVDGKITEVGSMPEEVLGKILKHMVDEESELITILYGKEVSEEEAAKLNEKLEQEFPDHEIEIIRGGQPLYYYLVSVE